MRLTLTKTVCRVVLPSEPVATREYVVDSRGLTPTVPAVRAGSTPTSGSMRAAWAFFRRNVSTARSPGSTVEGVAPN